jgi:zinc protease
VFINLLRGLLVALLFMGVPALAAPEVQEVRTPGGLTAWLVEDHHLPMVSVRLVFRDSGAAYAADVPAGAPNYAMAMLSEGAGELTSEAFDDALQQRALSLGFAVDYDHASASLDALSEHVGEGMRLMALALTRPRLDGADLTRVRKEIETSLRLQRQEPSYLAQRRFRQTVYGTHPYARPLLGDQASLARIDAKTLRRYLATYLRRDQLVIAVSGDITATQLATLLDTHLGSLPTGGGRAPLAATSLPVQSAPEYVSEPFPQAVAVFALPGITRDDPDFYAAYLMNYMLGGGGFESRLTDTVRRARGLTYSIYTGLVMDDASQLLQGGFATQANKAREAMQVVRDTLAKAYADGFTGEELARAKRYVTGSFPLDIDANRELVNYLMLMQLEGLGIDYLARRNDLINAVTLEDINRVTKRLLNPDRLVSIVIGDLPP